MSEFGIVTGSEVAINLDSDKKSRILQVQITDERDVQSIELYRMPGEDYNPSNGTRVLIIEIGTSKAAVAASDVEALDDLAEGEREYYSDDGEARLATIRLNGQSEIVLNAGEDYAVRYSKLEEAFDTLKQEFSDFVTTIYNTHYHLVAALPNPSGATIQDLPPAAVGTPSTADITGAKVEDIKVP
jgi:hypothetical protein